MDSVATPDTLSLNKGDVQEAIECARQLLYLYPPETHKIYGLGNTPAFLIEICKILDTQHPKHFEHIAFSGSWWFCDVGPNELDREEAYTPSFEQIKCYRSYLTTIGLDPKTLSMQDKRIVIVDLVDTGGSMKSFLEIFKNWADEIGVTKEIEEILSLYIFDPLFDPWVRVRTTEQPAFILNWPTLDFRKEKLCNFIKTCNKAQQEDRLVCNFCYSVWPTTNPAQFIHSEKVNKTLGYIKATL